MRPWFRIVAIAAFVAVASISVDCGFIFDGCDFAAGMASPMYSSALVIR